MRLIVVFLLAWFAVIGLRESEVGNSHTVLQWIALMGTPAAELVVCQYVMHWFDRFERRVYRVMKYGISFFLVCILVGQYYYYYVSGEFITLLAFENLDQVYLLVDIKIALLGCLILAIWKWISQSHDAKISSKWQGGGIILAALLLVVIQNTGITVNHVRHFKHPSPIYQFFKVSAGYAKNEYEMYVLQKKLEKYPFVKENVYSGAPIPKVNSHTNKPNVIVLFIEGTSARLLGCYGGVYPELTPHIDDFAQKSMVVKNYYNHTAATFRGTHGQLASCYPRRGGGGQGGWTDKDSKNNSSLIKYQTLPNVLRSNGYKTLFLSPHMRNDPYTSLLHMLNFESVGTLEDYKETHERANLYHVSVQDGDMYKWLTEIVSRQDENRPFFVCMYTVGTHSGIDSPDKESRYGIDNPTLRTLHYVDASFGKFWEWFQNSSYAQNTIVVVTADHCHYYDKDYVPLVKNEKDYRKIFVDKIPLIIYDPIHRLPEQMDVHGRTSLDLTPTILHLLNRSHVKNSFLGRSLFEPSDEVNMAALGAEYYFIDGANGVVKEEELNTFDKTVQDAFKKKKEQIELFYSAEVNNKVFP